MGLPRHLPLHQRQKRRQLHHPLQPEQLQGHRHGRRRPYRRRHGQHRPRRLDDGAPHQQRLAPMPRSRTLLRPMVRHARQRLLTPRQRRRQGRRQCPSLHHQPRHTRQRLPQRRQRTLRTHRTLRCHPQRRWLPHGQHPGRLAGHLHDRLLRRQDRHRTLPTRQPRPRRHGHDTGQQRPLARTGLLEPTRPLRPQLRRDARPPGARHHLRNAQPPELGRPALRPRPLLQVPHVTRHLQGNTTLRGYHPRRQGRGGPAPSRGRTVRRSQQGTQPDNRPLDTTARPRRTHRAPRRLCHLREEKRQRLRQRTLRERTGLHLPDRCTAGSPL